MIRCLIILTFFNAVLIIDRLYAESNEEPVPSKKIEDITLEVDENFLLSMDSESYFSDSDSKRLYYSIFLESDKEKYLHVNIDEMTNLIILKALKLPENLSKMKLKLIVFCDDDNNLTDAEASQSLNVIIQRPAGSSEGLPRDTEVLEKYLIDYEKRAVSVTADRIEKPQKLSIAIGSSYGNHRWGDRWFMEPIPYFKIKYRFIQLQIEGLQSEFENYVGLSSYTFPRRIAVVPMVLIGYKFLRLNLGYGFSYYRDFDNIWDHNFNMESRFKSKKSGILKLTTGIKLPILQVMHISVEGGFSYLKDNFYSVDVGAGLQYDFILSSGNDQNDSHERNWLSNSLIGAGVASSIASYYYHWKGNQTYYNYYSSQSTEDVVKLHKNAENHDKKAKYLLASGVTFILTGIINSILQ